jgi:hypothetical protein
LVVSFLPILGSYAEFSPPFDLTKPLYVLAGALRKPMLHNSVLWVSNGVENAKTVIRGIKIKCGKCG